jgi:hypothetical protein
MGKLMEMGRCYLGERLVDDLVVLLYLGLFWRGEDF